MFPRRSQQVEQLFCPTRGLGAGGLRCDPASEKAFLVRYEIGVARRSAIGGADRGEGRIVRVHLDQIREPRHVLRRRPDGDKRVVFASLMSMDPGAPHQQA